MKTTIRENNIFPKFGLANSKSAQSINNLKNQIKCSRKIQIFREFTVGKFEQFLLKQKKILLKQVFFQRETFISNAARKLMKILLGQRFPREHQIVAKPFITPSIFTSLKERTTTGDLENPKGPGDRVIIIMVR